MQDFVALGFHKKFSPENKLRHAVCANKFGFGAASGVEFLFAGSVEDATAPKSHGSGGVTFKVGTNYESCVNKPMDNVEAVSGKDEFVVPGFGREDHETQEFAPIILVGSLTRVRKVATASWMLGQVRLQRKRAFAAKV